MTHHTKLEKSASSCESFWKRAIILMDMNAFFASVEQRDDPALRGRPVVVTNGKMGSCVITCSYEARAYGIKTGMYLYEAKKLCPHLVRVPADPKRYTEASTTIMNALDSITPDIEIFSVDEAFLDVTHCQRLHGTPEVIGRRVKQLVFEVSGLHCSVGVSGDKTTAKFAAKLHKPNGFCVIPPQEAACWLANIPVTELCGIAQGIGRFLAEHGVFVCGDMVKLPISVLGKRYGNVGRRIWLMCQGRDPEPIKKDIPDPKSMGHGKVMPPDTRDEPTIAVYFQHMSEKLGARLRRHSLRAQHFLIAFKTKEWGWLGQRYRSLYPTQDGADIFQLAQTMMKQYWDGQGVYQVQVTALDPHGWEQLDLFAEPLHSEKILNDRHAIIDSINARYGEFSIMPAALLNRSSMPNVIAPAWKPVGHRQTIV